MPNPPPKSKPGEAIAKNSNPKGERLTSKHGKQMAHKAPERRMFGRSR
jgi:hypothetical protein